MAILLQENQYYIKGFLFFHGIKKEITIPVNFTLDDKKIKVDADFSISLTDYKIKRPSLLTIKFFFKMLESLPTVIPLPELL